MTETDKIPVGRVQVLEHVLREGDKLVGGQDFAYLNLEAHRRRHQTQGFGHVDDSLREGLGRLFDIIPMEEIGNISETHVGRHVGRRETQRAYLGREARDTEPVGAHGALRDLDCTGVFTGGHPNPVIGWAADPRLNRYLFIHNLPRRCHTTGQENTDDARGHLLKLYHQSRNSKV